MHRSPHAALGYYNDEEKTAEAFKDGWFHSGDLGVMTEDGYLSVVDRKKDMIKTGGENVASREIEEAIYELEGVAEVAVFGISHPHWIEAVTAVVVPKPGASLTAEDVAGPHARSSRATSGPSTSSSPTRCRRTPAARSSSASSASGTPTWPAERGVRSPGRPVAPQLRRARAAVAACFFINAVFYANLVPRLPEVKEQLGLSNSSLGAALAAVPLGALLAGVSSAVLIRRFGSGRVASSGLVLMGLTLWAVSIAPNWPALAAALLLAGVLDNIIDVAQNAHGLRVQRRYGRSILNAFHGIWSIGAVSGGLLGSAAAGLGIPLVWHLGGTAVVFGLLALRHPARHAPRPRRGRPRAEPGAARRRRRRTRVAVAAGDARRPTDGVPGAGGPRRPRGVRRGRRGRRRVLERPLPAQRTGGRCGGRGPGLRRPAGRHDDRPAHRRPRRRPVRAAPRRAGRRRAHRAAAWVSPWPLPSVATTLVGFALAGLGVATLIPAVYHAADELPGLPPGLGLAVINWLLRVGFLLSPLLIGVIADAASLRVALLHRRRSPGSARCCSAACSRRPSRPSARASALPSTLHLLPAREALIPAAATGTDRRRALGGREPAGRGRTGRRAPGRGGPRRRAGPPAWPPGSPDRRPPPRWSRRPPAGTGTGRRPTRRGSR